MSDATRQRHSQELQIATGHIARGKELIARQQAIAHDLRWAGGDGMEDAAILLNLLEDTQHLFENHADMLKRDLARKP